MSELDELRKQRAEQVKAQREEQTAVEHAEEIARLKRDIADDEKFREIKARETGSIIRINTDRFGMVVLKCPLRGRWNEFQDTYDPNAKNVSLKTYQLVVECLVYPTADALDSMLDKAPALLTKLMAGINIAAGELSASVDSKS